MPFATRRHDVRQHHLRPPLHVRRARSRCATSTTTWRRSRRPRSCSIRRGAARSSCTDAKNLAFAQGFELVEDEALLNEVAGLVEWPVVLMGTFEETFLKIPDEVIRATIRANQKCFVLRDPKTGEARQPLHPHRQHRAADGGKAIVAGNERVIRARLSDAKFFYETDLKTRLEDRLPKFKDIIFHEKLGTQAERIERIERLAGELAPLVGADVEKAKRAARLCKADLLTEMVGEFPEVQGMMGKYYALAQGEDDERRRTPSRITTSRPGRTTACRPIRCRSRSRSPTSSTRWSASGRSTRSRPGARTRMRCDGRRWG